MLPANELKEWLHRSISNPDKILLVLGSLNKPCQVHEVRRHAISCGLRAAQKWNVSSMLRRTKGLAVHTSAGWELSDAGKQHLRALGVGKISPAATKIATDLRTLLKKITDDETKSFVDEAVQCYELELYRSAVVMSWLAAIHVLRKEVLTKHLAAFNAEAQRVDSKWKSAKTTDEIGAMKEADFLDRLAAISMIGKNVKEELQKCLKLRNGCGHPSSLRIGSNVVANHIEILLLNVFNKFC